MIPQLALQKEAPDVTVFIAARHDRVRAALWQLLEGEVGIEPLAATADLTDMVRLLGWLRPSVVVVEQSVLGDTGLDALSTLVQVAPEAAIIVVGMHDHPGYVAWARDAGAADYVCLDEAVDRLGPSVVDAAELGAAVGRRSAGSRAVTVVPAPGADSIVRLPPSNSTRSRMLTSPNPPESPDLSNP
jgi:DNA-binding NarL/FixJ family response regulator